MDYIKAIKEELSQYIEPEKAEYLPKFFKAYPGGYGEGDKFIGVRVPNQRKIARKYYKKISLKEVEMLLQESIHEYRFTALIILVNKFQKIKKEEEKKEIVDLYLNNILYVNNWDLVDTSADKILGAYLFDKDKSLLYDLAQSDNLWKQRIAIISTFYFIKNHQFEDTLKLAKVLLNHEHDLIHKAVGWMLREIGKRDFNVEFNFLKEHYNKMPRTMLRYAIEKFEPELRKKFLKGLI
ncbi:DNA alkylation repair protein [Thermohalobacter berrensis]|uniref:DNA alkylation repair protein n=1 Tax=Thermohalobacter berrensis TaxID=99594 RepID=A0A419SXW0_9FIRM|nr:DNA alkylation repair protein [Thermohalobacter berrensis]RKD30025.1 DNA alkylation repair protein [Thermohalobacter berrensis]